MPPAESEIAEALNVSSPTVNGMLKSLEKKGIIRRRPRVARSIEILIADDAIPQWNGKRISRTVWEWTYVGPAASSPVKRRDDNAAIYRFRISLEGTHPEIWRRIETKDVTLAELHELIQAAMGWTNSHLHQFEIAGRWYTDPQLMPEAFEDASVLDHGGIRISQLVSEHGAQLRMSYEYDLGDRWQHSVVLESVTEPEPGVKYPRCIDGERACPPEDVGGVDGFADYVAAITNPNPSEHAELLEWSGPFDPAEFSATKATRRMSKAIRPR